MDRFNQISQEISFMEGGIFQKLCDRYLHQKYNFDLFTPGSMEGTNKTTAGTPDSYVYDNKSNSYILIMYGTHKNQEKKLQSDIHDAKAKSKIHYNKIKEIICCYSGHDISPSQHESLVKEAYPYKLKIIGSTQIAMDLVDEYHNLALEFFDVPRWTDQITDISKFVTNHDKSNTNATLKINYIDQDDILKNVKKCILNKEITVITGIPGVGKTKLAVETLKSFCNNSKENQCLFIKSNNLPLYEDLKGFLSEKRINYVFIDDANDIGDLKGILSLINQYKKIHFILTVRNYAVEYIKSFVLDYDYDFFNILPLKRDTMNSILIDNYNLSKNNFVTNKIIEYSNLNARKLVIAAQLNIDKGQEIFKDTSNIMISYYELIIKKANIYGNELKTLFIISIFDKIKFRNEELINKLLDELKSSNDDFIKSIKSLYHKEIVDIFRDEVVSIEDQSLRDYVLYLFLYKSKEYKLYDLFNLLSKVNFYYLYNSLSRAKAIGISDDDYKLLEHTTITFYKYNSNDITYEDKIGYMKRFGKYLTNEVLKLGKILSDNAPNSSRNICFSLNNFYKNNVNRNLDNFLFFMKILLLKDFKRYYVAVFELCLNYIEKDKVAVKKMSEFLTDMFGIDPTIKNPFEHIEMVISIFNKHIKKYDLVVNECLFFTLKGFLKRVGEKTIIVDDYFVPRKYRINDNSFDFNTLRKIFDSINTIANDYNFPKSALLNFLPRNIIYDKQYQHISIESLKYIYEIFDNNNKINVNNYDKYLINLNIYHVYYLMGNESSEKIINSFNEFQKCYWVMNNFSLKDQYNNLKLNPVVKDLKNEKYITPDNVYLCLMYSSLLCNPYLVNKNFVGILKNMDYLKRHSFLNEIIDKGLKSIDFNVCCSIINFYGPANFIEKVKGTSNYNIRLIYFAYSNIDEPSKEDLREFFNIIKDIKKEDWLIVSYESLNDIYQNNSEIVDLIVYKTSKFNLYNNFNFNVNSAKNILNNVSSNDKLFDCYTRGMQDVEFDYNLNLFNLIKDNPNFQNKFINSIFNLTFNNSGIIYRMVNILCENKHFCELITKIIFNLNNNFNYYSFGWNILFKSNNNWSKKFLLNLLKKATNLIIAKRIMKLVNCYLSYNDAIPFFQIISNKNFDLNNFELSKLSYSYSGSEVPVIEDNILFIKKISSYFSDVNSTILLDEKIDELDSLISKIKIFDYINNI